MLSPLRHPCTPKYLVIIPSCSPCIIVANYPVATNAFKGKTANEWFIVIPSRCRQNLKCGDFTLLFCEFRQRNARKYMLHVQHKYFSLSKPIISLLWHCRSRSRRLCLRRPQTRKQCCASKCFRVCGPRKHLLRRQKCF